MIRHLLKWLHRFLAPSYVACGPPRRAKTRGHTPKVVADRPPSIVASKVQFDPSRGFTESADGLLVQRGAVDLLLADGRMSRLGILACFDPQTHEPRRISYIPIHEMVPSTEILS